MIPGSPPGRCILLDKKISGPMMCQLRKQLTQVYLIYIYLYVIKNLHHALPSSL